MGAASSLISLLILAQTEDASLHKHAFATWKNTGDRLACAKLSAGLVRVFSGDDGGVKAVELENYLRGARSNLALNEDELFRSRELAGYSKTFKDDGLYITIMQDGKKNRNDLYYMKNGNKTMYETMRFNGDLYTVTRYSLNSIDIRWEYRNEEFTIPGIYYVPAHENARYVELNCDITQSPDNSKYIVKYKNGNYVVTDHDFFVNYCKIVDTKGNLYSEVFQERDTGVKSLPVPKKAVHLNYYDGKLRYVDAYKIEGFQENPSTEGVFLTPGKAGNSILDYRKKKNKKPEITKLKADCPNVLSIARELIADAPTSSGVNTTYVYTGAGVMLSLVLIGLGYRRIFLTAR